MGGANSSHPYPLSDCPPDVMFITCLFVLFFCLARTCAQIPVNARLSCGNVNQTVCATLGCCWNEREFNSSVQCFKKR